MRAGETVGGWVIERWLGRGASGEVWAARSVEAPEREVAIKRLPRPGPRTLARLEREAEALRRLDHPAVVSLYGLTLTEDAALLVMERVAGRPLSQLIRQPPISPAWALHLCAQLAEGLAAAHAAGVTHRDLKPANVMVDAAGVAVLLDFGTAALRGGAALTHPEGRRPATPAYAPPEWFTGGEEPEGACDVYALGLIALELLRGLRTFPQRDPAELEAAKRAEVQLSSTLQQHTLLRSMLAPSPGSRPDMAEVSAALAPWRARPTGAPDSGSETLSGSAIGWSQHPSAPTMDPQPVSHVGRYQVIEELGRGGMGVVYRAYDPNLDRAVALKVLLSGAHAGPAERARLQREARAVAQLDHPHLVRVLDQGEHEGHLFLTMALVDGPTLSARLDAEPVSPREAATWTRQLALALAHAHSAGLVHRDVKPGNVLLRGGAVPMLTDFGLVKDTREETAGLTRGGQLLGTPAYMAPEQARGELSAVGPWTDQYALGALLYRMLSGAPPHSGQTLPELLRRVAEEPAPPLPKGVDPELAAVAHRALERQRRDRYPSASEMAEDLGRYLRGEPVLAALPSPWRRLRSWASRRKLPLAAAALALLVLGLLGQEGWAQWSEQRAQRARWAAAEASWSALEARLGGLEAEEAEALLDAFVGSDDHQQTPALAEAWLRRAERYAGEPALERGALAQAYAVAVLEQHQVEALEALARHFRREHRWVGLATALGALEARGRALPQLRRGLAGWERDPEGSPELDGPTLQLLREATRTPWSVNSAARFTLDGQDALLLYDIAVDRNAGEVTLVDPRSPSLPELRALALPEALGGTDLDMHLHGLDGALVATVGHSPPYALTLDGAQLVATRPTEANALFCAASADTDGDGTSEHYLCQNRRLMRMLDDPLRLESAHDSTNHGNSEIRGVAAAELDGAPGDELVVATSIWGTYDLRVLGRGDGGELELLGRAQVGPTEQALVLRTPDGPRLATWSVAKVDQIIDRRVFSKRSPPRPPGLHLFALEEDSLRWTGQLPGPSVPPISGLSGPSFVADLNGDGLDDVIGGVLDNRTQIWWQQPGGGFEEGVLHATRPMALIQADEDPAAELVVAVGDLHESALNTSESRVYVLGAGSDRLPPRRTEAATPEAPPDGLTPSTRLSWLRAEELVAMGLVAEAVSRFEVLALALVDEERAARAWLRAAELYASMERWERAAALYLRAAAAPALAAQGLQGAQQSYAEDRRFEEELAVIRRLQGLGASAPELDARAEQLASVKGAPTIRVDFSEPLHPSWALGHPLGLRWDALNGGLDWQLADPDNALTLPLIYEGGYAALSLTLDVTRDDWGTNLRAYIGGEDTLRLVVSNHSGAGGAELHAGCVRWPHTSASGDLDLYAEGLTLHMDWTPWDGLQSCTVTDSEGRAWRSPRRALKTLTPGERVTLRLIGGRTWSGVFGATLRSVELKGFSLAEPDASPSPELLILYNRTEEALADLQGASPSLAAARYALGDLEDAERVLIELAGASSPDPGLLRLLFLVEPERHEAALRAALGRGYYAAFYRAWNHIINTAPERPEVRRALTRGLDGLSALPISAHPDAEAWLSLLISRAAARRERGDLTRSRADLERAVALGERLLRDPARANGARAHLTLAWKERALLELSLGQPEAALEALLVGLEVAPSPEWLADRLARDPQLTPLTDLPRWSEVEDARGIQGE